MSLGYRREALGVHSLTVSQEIGGEGVGVARLRWRGPGTKKFAALDFRFDILFTLDMIVRQDGEIICKHLRWSQLLALRPQGLQ
jgi:hypothetical protein